VQPCRSQRAQREGDRDRAGIADLRGLSPLQRARAIIDNCAHPLYRDYLHRYLESAPGGHIHHDLAHAFDLHRNLLEHGSMLG
jgi:acyl-CoA hydrolase